MWSHLFATRRHHTHTIVKLVHLQYPRLCQQYDTVLFEIDKIRYIFNRLSRLFFKYARNYNFQYRFYQRFPKNVCLTTKRKWYDDLHGTSVLCSAFPYQNSPSFIKAFKSPFKERFILISMVTMPGFLTYLRQCWCQRIVS